MWASFHSERYHCELGKIAYLTYQGPAIKNPDFFGVFCYLNILNTRLFRACLEFKLGSEPFFCFWSGLHDWFRKTTY